MKAARGKHHEHLGMTLDHSNKGKMKVDMTKCIKDMLKDFPVAIEKIALTPCLSLPKQFHKRRTFRDFYLVFIIIIIASQHKGHEALGISIFSKKGFFSKINFIVSVRSSP